MDVCKHSGEYLQRPIFQRKFAIDQCTYSYVHYVLDNIAAANAHIPLLLELRILTSSARGYTVTIGFNHYYVQASGLLRHGTLV